MVFPAQLTDYLQPAVDKFTFVIMEALDVSELGIDITGGTSAFNVPCIINIEDELIHIESKTSTTLTASASGRGYGGTTAATHADGSTGYIPLTAEHYAEMVDGAASVLKYLCRTVASLPATGLEEEYDLVEYADEIYMYNGSSWERVGLTFSHDDWKNLDSGDPHPVYYTVSELVAAHDALSGGHVTGGDNHDHLDGVGFGAIDTTTARVSSAPTYDGEVVLDTATGILYVSYIVSTPDSGDWIEVTGAPAGLIMAFDPANLSGACPSGWTRYTTLDEKFIKGTTSGTQTTGGSATHAHTFDATDVVSHSHSIDAQTMDATTSKSHTHTYASGNSGGSFGPVNWYGGGTSSTVTSSSAGDHSHTATMSNDTESTGEASPTTETANGEPPYQKVIWCQKS